MAAGKIFKFITSNFVLNPDRLHFEEVQATMQRVTILAGSSQSLISDWNQTLPVTTGKL